MLGIALGAIILGCLLMTILFAKYGFSTKVSAVATPVPALALGETGRIADYTLVN